VLEIKGARRYIGRQDEERMVSGFATALENRLRSGSGKQHSFSMGFRSETSSVSSLIEDMLSGARKTAEVFGILNTRMLDERAKRLAQECVDETVYLVIRTHAQDMQPHERKIQMEERSKRLQKLRKDAGAGVDQWNAQTVPYPMGALLPKHKAAVASLVDDLSRDLDAGGAQLLVQVLEAHDAIIAIRRHVQAAMLQRRWRPRLLGDRNSSAGSLANGRDGESGWVTPMRISRQIVSASVEDHSGIVSSQNTMDSGMGLSCWKFARRMGRSSLGGLLPASDARCRGVRRSRFCPMESICAHWIRCWRPFWRRLATTTKPYDRRTMRCVKWSTKAYILRFSRRAHDVGKDRARSGDGG